MEEKVNDYDRLLEEKARIERRIKVKRLPRYKVEQVGGYIKSDEIFVQISSFLHDEKILPFRNIT